MFIYSTSYTPILPPQSGCTSNYSTNSLASPELPWLCFSSLISFVSSCFSLNSAVYCASNFASRVVVSTSLLPLRADASPPENKEHCPQYYSISAHERSRAHGASVYCTSIIHVPWMSKYWTWTFWNGTNASQNLEPISGIAEFLYDNIIIKIFSYT